jgi:thioredoxin reductase (NADPH)
LIVVGAGPAGLSAGIYGARSGLRTLVLEEKMAGGTTADAPLIENYLGFERISGMDLAQKMVAHSRTQKVQINEFENVVSVDLKGENKAVTTAKSTYETKTVIIATGAHYRHLNIPGEKEFTGRGVSFCAICDGPLFAGKRLVVVGGGNSALIATLYLSSFASEVKVVHRRDVFRAEEAYVNDLKNKRNVEVLWNTEAKEIKGGKLVDKVAIFNNKSNETMDLAVDGVFVQIGEDPNSQFAQDAGVAVDRDGFVIVDRLQRTNIDGVYAIGDVSNHPVKQVGTAVGMGITAALEAYAFIKRPYYKR